jgi:hypothetical protein
VSPRGFWLLIRGRELFVPFAEFPWFRDASVAEIAAVEQPGVGHLYWPLLDIDLAVDSIEHPARYPLVSRAQSASPPLPADNPIIRERGPRYGVRRPRTERLRQPRPSTRPKR